MNNFENTIKDENLEKLNTNQKRDICIKEIKDKKITPCVTCNYLDCKCHDCSSNYICSFINCSPVKDNYKAMLTREEIIKKVESLEEKQQPLSMIVTVVKLPTGALEVITNTQFLIEKINYILKAYDENLRLKTCNDIQLMDCIIL